VERSGLGSPRKGEMPIYQNAGPVGVVVAGQFSNAFLNFFSLNLVYKFGAENSSPGR